MTTLYKKMGKSIGYWKISVTDNAELEIVHAKKLDGEETRRIVPVKAKNVGRANETTELQQAHLEALSRTIMYDSQILGVPYYILFYNEDTDTIDLIDGAEALRSSRIIWKKALLASCKPGDLSGMFEKVFSLEPLSETLRRYNKEYQ